MRVVNERVQRPAGDQRREADAQHGRRDLIEAFGVRLEACLLRRLARGDRARLCIARGGGSIVGVGVVGTVGKPNGRRDALLLFERGSPGTVEAQKRPIPDLDESEAAAIREVPCGFDGLG